MVTHNDSLERKALDLKKQVKYQLKKVPPAKAKVKHTEAGLKRISTSMIDISCF